MSVQESHYIHGLWASQKFIQGPMGHSVLLPICLCLSGMWSLVRDWDYSEKNESFSLTSFARWVLSGLDKEPSRTANDEPLVWALYEGKKKADHSHPGFVAYFASYCHFIILSKKGDQSYGRQLLAHRKSLRLVTQQHCCWFLNSVPS